MDSRRDDSREAENRFSRVMLLVMYKWKFILGADCDWALIRSKHLCILEASQPRTILMLSLDFAVEAVGDKEDENNMFRFDNDVFLLISFEKRFLN